MNTRNRIFKGKLSFEVKEKWTGWDLNPRLPAYKKRIIFRCIGILGQRLP